jgi:hypothetical protein
VTRVFGYGQKNSSWLTRSLLCKLCLFMMKDLTVTSGESILQWKEIYFIKWVINNSFLAHRNCDVHLQTSSRIYLLWIIPTRSCLMIVESWGCVVHLSTTHTHILKIINWLKSNSDLDSPPSITFRQFL